VVDGDGRGLSLSMSQALHANHIPWVVSSFIYFFYFLFSAFLFNDFYFYLLGLVLKG